MTVSDGANPGDKFRLKRQAGTRRAEGINVSGPALAQRAEEAPSRRETFRDVFAWWSIAAGAALFFIALVAFGTGPSSWKAKGSLALVALIPLFAVTVVLGWIDRWAPLSWRTKVVAIVFGAVVGGGAAMVINTGLSADFVLYTGNIRQADFWSSVYVAPVVEEMSKGIVVVWLLLAVRHRISSALSGAALGGLVGAGFAYVENILYFVAAHQEGSAVLGITIFARGVMSPFIHPMATSCTGVAVALAILGGVRAWGWIWRILLGLSGAIGIHMLWNFLASVTGASWIWWYALLEVPLLILWLGALLTWSSRQRKLVRRGLEAYVHTGWVTEAEAMMAFNPRAGKYARKWARKMGSPAPRLVRRFIGALRRLGLDQEVMVRLGPSRTRMANDARWLAEVGALRSQFVEIEGLRGGAK